MGCKNSLLKVCHYEDSLYKQGKEEGKGQRGALEEAREDRIQ